MIKKIKIKFRAMKLWQKLLFIYLAISVIPLTCLCVFNALNTTKLVRNQVNARLIEITSTTSSVINNNIDMIDSIISQTFYSDNFNYAVHNNNLSNLLDNSLNYYLKSTQEKINILFDNKALISFYTFNGAIVKTDSYKVSYRDNKKIFSIIPPKSYRYITIKNNNVELYYKTIDLNDNAKQTGILKISIPTSEFIGSISLKGIDQYIFIIEDKSDNILYYKSDTIKNYGNVVLNILKKANKNTVYIHNEAFVFKPLYINSAKWNLILLIPQISLYQNFSKILWEYINLAIICLGLVGIFSVLSSLNISKRIDNISSEMSLISDGQIEMNVDIDTTGDELGKLSVLFHQMMNRINSLVIEQYKTEIKLHEEQLEILQNQINPHFLYNCMDTINWRCILNNDIKTSCFANNLADFYRTCLNKGKTNISLRDEFKNIHSYIYLQLDMHDNSFLFEENVNPLIYEYEGINLMLQPIVENAIVHGLEVSDNTECLIKISADFNSDRSKIIIIIFNNGNRITDETAKLVSEGKKGYGLSNVSNRIKLYFGQQYGISIKAVEGGTSCVITIPAKRLDNNE